MTKYRDDDWNYWYYDWDWIDYYYNDGYGNHSNIQLKILTNKNELIT